MCASRVGEDDEPGEFTWLKSTYEEYNMLIVDDIQNVLIAILGGSNRYCTLGFVSLTLVYKSVKLNWKIDYPS